MRREVYEVVGGAMRRRWERRLCQAMSIRSAMVLASVGPIGGRCTVVVEERAAALLERLRARVLNSQAESTFRFEGGTVCKSDGASSC